MTQCNFFYGKEVYKHDDPDKETYIIDDMTDADVFLPDFVWLSKKSNMTEYELYQTAGLSFVDYTPRQLHDDLKLEQVVSNTKQ